MLRRVEIDNCSTDRCYFGVLLLVPRCYHSGHGCFADATGFAHEFAVS